MGRRIRGNGEILGVVRLIFDSPLIIFLVALLARLGNLHIGQILNLAAGEHLAFGYEAGRIARALAEGHGFSSPFLYATGPTAWLGPVYPLLVAACFKLFGVYSFTSAMAVLSMNCVFAALTCVVVHRIGRETLGRTVGLIAAWFLVVSPFEINFATRWIWDTSLSALLLSTAFLLTLWMVHAAGPLKWSGYGVLWGVIALTNPSLLSFLPVALVWLWFRQERSCRMLRLTVALLAFAVTLIPWTLRNYYALHSFIPVRDNIAMELYLGNHKGADGFIRGWMHPIWNRQEMADYAQRGELGYLDKKRQVFSDFVRAHPAQFVLLTLKRVLIFWAGALDRGKPSPQLIDVRQGLYFTSSFVALWGLLRVIRRRQYGASLYAGIVLLYPLVYYVTHNHPRYRHPIEPLLALLGAWLFCTAAQEPASWFRREKAAESEPVLVAAASNTTVTSNTGRIE